METACGLPDEEITSPNSYILLSFSCCITHNNKIMIMRIVSGVPPVDLLANTTDVGILSHVTGCVMP
jgi:hypothetical protein